MKIKIITCHDVYNVGASLQAFALQTYLNTQGHETEIIDYKPGYLSRHYSLYFVANPKYDRPIIKQMYLLAKLPKRLRNRKSRKKEQFDTFRHEFLNLTSVQYRTNEELKNSDLEADIFIAGSDQIWNPLFENGKDSSFFLDFVNTGKKISYAASFAVETVPENIVIQDKKWLQEFHAVSVRESRGVEILENMGIKACHVCDPVFLLNYDFWNDFISQYGSIADTSIDSVGEYVFIYDFDGSNLIDEIVRKIKTEKKKKVYSYFSNHDADAAREVGPIEFLKRLRESDTVISNSFHATAFSMIFHKEFYVVERKELINSRLHDLLQLTGLEDRCIMDYDALHRVKPIDWDDVDFRIRKTVQTSKAFLDRAINE